MPSISSLIRYLSNSRIVAPIKQLSLYNQRSINAQNNIAKIADVNILPLITLEIDAIKKEFPGRKVIMQNLKRLPLVETESELFAANFATAFSLAFNNILRNACMYTNANSPIIVIGERKGLKTFISVLDYGQGIPEAEIEKVLNLPSSQHKTMHTETNTSTNIYVGIDTDIETSELGLSIAKQAMEKFGGSMTLKNHKNVGLLVTLGL